MWHCDSNLIVWTDIQCGSFRWINTCWFEIICNSKENKFFWSFNSILSQSDGPTHCRRLRKTDNDRRESNIIETRNKKTNNNNKISETSKRIWSECRTHNRRPNEGHLGATQLLFRGNIMSVHRNEQNVCNVDSKKRQKCPWSGYRDADESTIDQQPILTF